MSSQSTQTSRPAELSTPYSSWTNAPSLREYETKTSATAYLTFLDGALRLLSGLPFPHDPADVDVDVLGDQRLDGRREAPERGGVRPERRVGAGELVELPALALQQLDRTAVVAPAVAVVEEPLDGHGDRDHEAERERRPDHGVVEVALVEVQADEGGHDQPADDRDEAQAVVPLLAPVRLALEPDDLVEPARAHEALLALVQVQLVDQRAELLLQPVCVALSRRLAFR